ncbi:MAG: hypothetical protein JWO98_3754 [Frankiales bacterium]|nr:hypothetical protein [Frankiales bacterium]
MSRPARAVLAGLAVTVVTVAPARAETPGALQPVEISQDTTTTRADIGAQFTFTTTVRNAGDQPLSGLVAHLNIVSLHADVTVDPEDWSTHRTQYLAAVPPHASTRLSWSVHAVNDGRFVVYVAVTTAAADTLTAGPALHAVVSPQRHLDAGGVLPVAVAVPAVVLVLLIAVRRRRRRMI